MKNRNKNTTIPQISYTTIRVFFIFFKLLILKRLNNKKAPLKGANLSIFTIQVYV